MTNSLNDLFKLLLYYLFFFNARNDVPSIVTPDAVVKVDHSTAANPLALTDVRKPDLHPPEGTAVE
ncbi:hypothetical protein Hanom_Chr09g00837191 [Helianthus anomalus]